METTQFAGRFVRATTELVGGRTIERVHVRDGVSVIVRPSPGYLRCIREYDAAQSRMRMKLVSGWLEEKEDPLARAQRELREELGLEAREWTLFHEARMEGAVLKNQHFFYAAELERVGAEPEAGENITPVDLELGDLAGQIFEGSFGSTETAFVLLKFIKWYRGYL